MTYSFSFNITPFLIGYRELHFSMQRGNFKRPITYYIDFRKEKVILCLRPQLHTQKRHRAVTACCCFRSDTGMIS